MADIKAALSFFLKLHKYNIPEMFPKSNNNNKLSKQKSLH